MFIAVGFLTSIISFTATYCVGRRASLWMKINLALVSMTALVNLNSDLSSRISPGTSWPPATNYRLDLVMLVNFLLIVEILLLSEIKCNKIWSSCRAFILRCVFWPTVYISLITLAHVFATICKLNTSSSLRWQRLVTTAVRAPGYFFEALSPNCSYAAIFRDNAQAFNFYPISLVSLL